MRIEDVFEISINNDEANTTRTVNDLIELVKDKTAQPTEAVCHTSSMFYKVRQAVINTIKIERKEVKVDSLLESFFSSDTICDNWKSIELNIGCKIPELELPHIITIPINITTLALFSTGAIIALFNKSWLIVALTITLSAAFRVVLSRLLKSKRTRIPREIATIKSFIHQILIENSESDLNETKRWTDNEICQITKTIISDQMGIPVDEISKDDSFVEDLRIS